MSFLFDGSGDYLSGTLGTTYGKPITLAAHVKFTTHPSPSSDVFLTLGNSASSIDHCLTILTSTVDDEWYALSRTTGANQAIVSSVNRDDQWTSVVGVFTSNTLRDLYIQTISQTGQSTGTSSVTDAMQYIRAGVWLDGARYLTGKLAELAIWDSALSTADITSYLAGTAASGIDAANLIEYVPMSTNSLLNLGTDTDGDLTATGNAVFDADHPIITSGTPKGRMLMTGIG
jgi:hypothetical protein